MKAAVLHELGKAPKYEEFGAPKAGDGEALIRVLAASLKPVDRQLAAGTHFASPRELDLPLICGTDGVGELEDGTRVLFGGCAKPFGAMADSTVAPRAFCFPIPPELDEEAAAGLANPGVSAWLSLTECAKLAPGETVLILGATGVTGQLAVQIAKLLGASRVVGVGRNKHILQRLRGLGADATIQLDQAKDSLRAAYLGEIGASGFDVILDYLWGEPTEAMLSAITKSEFAANTKEMRLIQVGESAGATINLPAAVLRSTRITLSGTGGIPSLQVLRNAIKRVFEHGALGELRIETQRTALAEIESVWNRERAAGQRIIVIP